MSPMETNISSVDPTIVIANRTAIDSSGRLGSLYDGYRDQVLGTLNISGPEELCQSHDTLRCKIVYGSKNQSQNILKMVTNDDDSRLSIILNLREKHDIAAIADYSSPINEYTRLLCYTYVNRIQKLSDDAKDVRQIIKSSTPQTTATHIITRVHRGIDVVIVLQLPADTEMVREIDQVLRRICNFLRTEDDAFMWSANEEIFCGHIVNTKVYSNTFELQNVTTLYNVCRYIQQNKNSTVDHPVSYTLRSIKWLYPQYNGKSARFTRLTTELNNNIEQHLFQIQTDIKRMETFLNEDVLKILCGHLREQAADIQKQLLNMKNKYTSIVQRFSKLILDVRSGRISMSSIDKELNDDEYFKMKDLSHKLTQNLEDLKEKGYFINDLNRQHFQYVNVADHNIDRTDTETTIENKLIKDDRYDRILCSNDILNKDNSKQLRKLHQNLIEEFKNDSSISLTYADFSYCSYELHYMMRLPLSKFDNENKKFQQSKTSSSREIQTKLQTTILPYTKPEIYVESSPRTQTTGLSFTRMQNSTPSSAKPQSIIPPYTRPDTYVAPLSKIPTIIPSFKEVQTTVSPITKGQTYTTPSIGEHNSLAISPSLLDHGTINILLLGETGVGKSTFINAFANYLTFNTLSEAQSSKPMVLIPVSFIITVGDNFEDYPVKFGHIDHANNEDFYHPGQSVTQHCRSYMFDIHHTNGKKLRIIDTPGFGDTRGIDQDDHNMQHILEYIKTLSHLNAVCFLLKPNESRLNIFFRSCVTQLFAMLGPDISDNVIFCFTNSRSTFYTPGNTAPLLKKMLASLSVGKVPFKKENTFCFDSESFRYLVARQNRISFSDDEKREYKMSWVNSVTEANRLIRYIRNNLPAYHVLDGQ